MEPEAVRTDVVELRLEDVAPSDEYVGASRGSEAMRRLTREQFILAVRDVFGADIVSPSIAEPDVARGGLRAIGASFDIQLPWR